MPVHIFVASEENFEICVRRGLAAVPGGKRPDTTDQLISRMAMIRRDDRILFYIVGKKEIHGVYRALDRPFFDDAQVWPSREDGQVYPLRIRIDNTERVFRQPVLLSDIFDLRDNGLIWTFSLERPSGTNSLFAISNNEFDEILRLYLKVNNVAVDPQQIREPYRHVEPNLRARLSFDSTGQPKYEATVSALFLDALSRGHYSQVLGAYSDYLAYIPTSFQKEIDALLIHPFPGDDRDVVAYTLIEIKRDRFTEDGLSQLLRYEDWFLKKRVGGDSRAIRTVAIARSFDERVLDYLSQRSRLEGKTVRLLRYGLSSGELTLDAIQLP